jgi:sugar O-acyltransferase (sialic acid O-acetyltransferase NeuD family)
MSRTAKEIAIFGAGGFGREVLLLLHQINENTPSWHITGFFDDQPPHTPQINGMDYLGDTEALNALNRPLNLVIAIGDSRLRSRIRQQITNPLISFPVLIHPSVSVKPYQFIRIGEGTVICQGTILTTTISLGRFVIINLACTIGHDTDLGDYCSLMPRVNLGGNASLAPLVYIGTNASVLPSVRIGSGTTVGAGAVVIRDLPANCTAVGVPAQILKTYEPFS